MSKKIKISDLKPDSKNHNKHTESGMALLESSVDQVGIIESITVSSDNEIISGNARHEVIGRKLNTEPIVIETDGKRPVIIRRTDIKSNTKEFYTASILANTTAKKNIDIDLDVVEALTSEYDLDVESIGIDLESKETAEEDDFEIPDVVKTDIVLGDLFEIGQHRLLCGDSTDPDQVVRLMGGQKADMVFTDPPYGVDYQGGVIHGNKINVNHKRTKLENDSVDIFSKFIGILPLVIDNGPLYVFYGIRNSYELFKPLKDNGISVMTVLAWIKINTGYSDMNSHYKNRYEPCVYCKIGERTNFIGPTNENTTWEILKDRDNKLHPTQKPISVPYRAIKNHTANTVADLFLGSGSTMAACHQLNRKCYGMELDPKFCQVIVDRMRKLVPGIVITKNGKAYQG